MSVNIGFVGAGGIASWQHFGNLEAMDEAAVVGICDIDRETAEEAADRFEAAAFTEYEQLYDEVDLDVVFVCLPPFAHGEPEIAAAEAGYDLFVEKPLALSMDTAREILAAIEDNDVLAQVGYNWRYSAGVDRARELLDGRSIGYIDGYWWGGVAGGEDHWWRSKERSGGQTVEQATHIFDTVRYLGGDVEEVAAAGANRLEELVDFADVSSATMTHDTGVVSHVSTSCAAERGKVGLEVIADGATLNVGQGHVTGSVDDEEIDEEFEQDQYATEVEAFLAAVQTGDTSDVRSPYDDAIESLALTLAVNESIETGEAVDPDSL